jgi:RHS repeat-associated protein
VAKASCPSSGAYRYGYQGEFAEKDNETDWNSFELRQYDSEIGRWLSVDSHRQYWSPYVSVANDPVNTIDKDGADGILLIDHVTKTITVNAVYYVTHGLASQYSYSNREISGMQTQINSMLNSQKYSISQTGYGNNEFDGYKVVFNLQFIGTKISPPYMATHHFGIFGANYSNSIGRNNDSHFPHYPDGGVTAGYTTHNKYILMNNNYLSWDNATYMNIMHEIFHTFGFKHLRPFEMDGIMKYPPDLPTQTDINMLLWSLPMFTNPFYTAPAVDNPVRVPVSDSCNCSFAG